MSTLFPCNTSGWGKTKKGNGAGKGAIGSIGSLGSKALNGHGAGKVVSGFGRINIGDELGMGPFGYCAFATFWNENTMRIAAAKEERCFTFMFRSIFNLLGRHETNELQVAETTPTERRPDDGDGGPEFR